RLAMEHQPDVVLLDLAMPVMDGLQAISGIRQSCPETKVVVLSGFERERMGVEAIERGAHAYFEKGIRPDLLTTRVAEICGGPLTAAEEPFEALATLPGTEPRLGLLNAALADVETPVGFDAAALPAATSLDVGGELAA